MKTLKDKQEILIRYINRGDSIRQISRDLGISRKTVSRYISQYSEVQKALISSPSEIEGFVEDFVKAPKYDSSQRVRPKVTSVVIN